MKELCSGVGISSFDLTGEVYIIDDQNYMKYISLCKDKILVIDAPSPSVVLILNEAKALLTRRGGATCHAACICREIGKPAIVGISDVLESVKSGSMVRIVSKDGRGVVYEACTV